MKTKITLIFLLISTWGSAQTIKVGVQGGYSALSAPSADFQSFMSTYNTALSYQMKNPFPPKMKLFSGYQLGATAMIGKKVVYYFSSVTWDESRGRYQADFVNNDSRRLDFHYTDVKADVGLGFKIGPVRLSFFAGMLSRFASIKASYLYANGLQSFGPERSLNGIYTTVRAVGYWGGELAAKIHGKFDLYFRLDKTIGSGINSTYDDLSMYRGINGISSLPVDYSQINAIGYKGVTDDSKNQRITIGARFNFYTY